MHLSFWFIFQVYIFLFRVFNEEAHKDYERFRKQEVRDLKEVLAAHIKTQMILCKLVCYGTRKLLVNNFIIPLHIGCL